MLTATSAPARCWFQDLFRWPFGGTFGFSALPGFLADAATTFGQTDPELLAAACRPVPDRGPLPEALAEDAPTARDRAA